MEGVAPLQLMQHTIILRYYRLEWEWQKIHPPQNPPHNCLFSVLHTKHTRSYKAPPPTAPVEKVLITLLMITLHTPTIKLCSSRAWTLKSPSSSQQLFLYINSDIWCQAETVCVSAVCTHTQQILHVFCAIDIPAVLDLTSNPVTVTTL